MEAVAQDDTSDTTSTVPDTGTGRISLVSSSHHLRHLPRLFPGPVFVPACSADSATCSAAISTLQATEGLAEGEVFMELVRTSGDYLYSMGDLSRTIG